MQRGEGSQLPAPAGFDAAGGPEFGGDFAHQRAEVRLLPDGQSVLDALPGGQGPIGKDGAFQQPRTRAGGSAHAQSAEDRHRQNAQQQGHLTSEPGTVDQHQARYPLRPKCQGLQRNRAAEGVTDDVERPGFAENVDRAQCPFCESGQRDRAFGALGEAEPGHVDRDHPVCRREPLVLRCPVVQTATDAV